MKTLIAAAALLAAGATVASAQYYPRERGEYREYRERRLYGGNECGEIRRSIFELERSLRNGSAGGGTRPALYEARAKYARYCR